MRIIVPLPTDNTAPIPPTKTDGEMYPFLVYFGNDAIYADSCTEVIGAMIDGYDAIPDDEDGADTALVERYLWAAGIASAAQGSINAEAHEKGYLDQLSQEQVDVVFADKRDPLDTLAWPDGFNGPVPVILFETDYAPFVTERPKPAGSIIWVNVYDELSFLESLANLGVIGLQVPRVNPVTDASNGDPATGA